MAPTAITSRPPLPHHLLLSLAQLAIVLLSASADVRAASKPFQVLVPNKTYFKEFVDCSDRTAIKGFSIDVFKNALSILIPKPSWTEISYTCYSFDDTSMTKPTYDGMLDALSNESLLYDAVVGDVTISAARLENGNFTQPYLDSGIVMLAPAAVGVSQHFPGVLFTPFTAQTWGVMGLSVVFTGIALWLLERNEHPHIGEQSKSEQFKRDFWFVTSILVFFKRESIKNPLAKFVMIAWILVMMLLSSSYMASLVSILTVYELSAEAKDISTLAKENLPIGYQVGSIVRDYLMLRYNISNSSLIPLNSTDNYSQALALGPHAPGGVAVVIDEIPYISLFLEEQPASDCKFSVSSKLTIEGLGFAFRNSSLAAAFSVAILNLSESGQMQKLQDGSKLSNYQCPSQLQATQLDLKSSEGLFVLLGLAMFAFTVFFFVKPHFVRKVLPRGSTQPESISAFQEPSFHRSFRRRPSKHSWIS